MIDRSIERGFDEMWWVLMTCLVGGCGGVGEVEE